MNNSYCKVPIGDYVNTRRCFITGEYCSKQTDIYKAKEKLYKNDEINAFVVMNFSNMSDVAYEQRLKPFVEGLTKYFYITDSRKEIICVKEPNIKFKNIDNVIPIKKINVVRADSSFVSNFVICNRVCQQMQAADLIVVDVSVKNANVFYELGMAIAMGKLILPVCFTDSYFHKDKAIDEMELEHKNQKGDKMQRHIACYTWRRQLFEYYGLRFKDPKYEYDDVFYLKVNKQGDWETELEKKDELEKKKRIDSIVSAYFKFPYDEISPCDNEKIGYTIYNKLSESYNKSKPENNTLLLYTLERFLNHSQTGLCIINYYNYITSQMKKSECFCGDRVGTLAQNNYVPEEDKDDIQNSFRQLPYNVSEIIHLGVNQATYATYQETIKPIDFLNSSGTEMTQEKKNKKNDSKYIRFLKEYTGNRSILIYPQNPVYVERYKEQVQPDLLNDDNLEKYFCLYHIMLNNLKYVREIVVDISDTSLESLFWLGMAHGADVYAITVQRQTTDRERKQISGASERKERSIFDVAGLWCALFRSDDTQGFYRQLQSVNQNIEQHSKLTLPNMYQYETEVQSLLHTLPWERSIKKTAEDILRDSDDESMEVLESYYRNRFWRVMLKDNHVQVYVQEKDEKIKETEKEHEDIEETQDGLDLEPRTNVSRWDFDAMATLSRYLARRTPIGEYEVITCKKDTPVQSSMNYNVINLGTYSKPFLVNGESADLSDYIKEKCKESESAKKIRSFWKDSKKCNCKNKCNDSENFSYIHFRGFVVKDFKERGEIITDYWFTQLAHANCRIGNSIQDGLLLYDKKKKLEDSGKIMLPLDYCSINNKNNHLQLGQITFWREGDNEERHFYISLVGTSGPATKALSSLLVSAPLKKVMFDKECGQWENKYLLLELQTTIRKQFIEEFVRRCRTDNIAKPVMDAVKLYLTTILYRHFFPFLTYESENRIINGADFFLRMLRIADDLNKSDQKSLGNSGAIKDDTNIKKIIGILKKQLNDFKGVDALYQVNVKVNGTMKEDSRSIISINPMKECGKEDNHEDWLRCIYL